MTDKTERRYSVQAISIRRPYGKGGDYDATVNIATQWGDEIKVKLPEDRIEAFIDSVSDLIVEALRQQLSNMKEDFLTHQEEKRLAELPPPAIDVEAEQMTASDDIPF